MARYIDAELLEAALFTPHIYDINRDDVIALVAEQPTTDVVEVVRCRDCANCEIVTDQFDNDWYFCNQTKDKAEVKPDDYCSDGIRRTDNDL